MSLYLGDIPIANDGLQRLTGEIGDIGIAPLGIDESLNLRRYLNGQVISQMQFEAFTTKVKSAVALFPSLATTESNWQAEKALSKFSQVGKFVIDDENQTIRLPAVVNAQGLLGLSGIGNVVNESLPNITGAIRSGNDGASVGTFYSAEGAFSDSTGESVSLSVSISKGTTNRVLKADFNASNSSTAYQDNAPVQQEAIQYPYYIQVATGIEEELPAIREYGINTPFFFGWSMYSENAPYNASLLASQGQYNASNLYPDLWTQLTGVELNTSLNVGDTIEISGKTYVKRGLPVKLSTDTYDDYDFVVNQDNSQFRLPLLNGKEDWVGNTSQTLSTADIVSGTPFSWTATKNGFIKFTCYATATQVVIAKINNQEINRTGAATSAAVTTRPGFWLKVKKGDVVSIAAESETLQHVGITFIPAVGNGTLYYYVGDTVQDASLINAGAVLSDVVNLKQTTLRTDQITNCITEIPQDIKLELNDGTLTLKAGSKGYVPNGFEEDGTTPKFDTVTIISDKTVTLYSNNDYCFVMYNPANDVADAPVGTVFTSGTTPPNDGMFYNTADNTIKFYSSGSASVTGYTFPIARIYNNNGTATSIDQIFNGFGYIGSTVFALPGVKGLIPNGRNADGSLRNIEAVATSVTTTTVTEKSREITIFLEQNGKISKWGSDNGNVRQYKSRPATPEKTYVKAYIEDENIWWYGDSTTTWVNKQYLVPSFKVYTDANALITSSIPKLPFRAIDYSDSAEVAGWAMPSSRYIDLTLGARAARYTAPANGWFAFGKRCSAAGQYFNVTYVSPLNSPFWSDDSGAAVGDICGHLVPVAKGQIISIDYSAGGATVVCRFIYAEGEE